MYIEVFRIAVGATTFKNRLFRLRSAAIWYEHKFSFPK